MKTIYLIYPPDGDMEEQGVVAAFDQKELAQAFIDRHPRFYGRYTMEETGLNPHFEVTEEWFYMVILDPNRVEPDKVFALTAFEDETQIYNRPVQKSGGHFFLYLFAADKEEALQKGYENLKEIMANGEWQTMPDEADESDADDDKP